MARLGMMGSILLLGLFAVQCSPGGSLARPVASTDAAATATPWPKQTSSTSVRKATSQTVLTEAVQRLDEVQSYQFTISAVLKNSFEGRPREWNYQGSGAFAKPDRITWTLEGQADVFMQVDSSGGKVSCKDTRGENTRDCSLAFGGPRAGSSPFTVIAYLRSFDQVGTLDQKSIDGVAYDHMTFSPSLPKVSSLEPGISRALSAVTSVQGEAWIDQKLKLPVRERVVVNSSSPSGSEAVDMTIVFSRFNERVDIAPSR